MAEPRGPWRRCRSTEVELRCYGTSLMAVWQVVVARVLDARLAKPIIVAAEGGPTGTLACVGCWLEDATCGDR